MIHSVGSKFALLVLCAGVSLAVVAQTQSIPPDVPIQLKKLIGEYRSTDSQLTIFEADGHLVAAGSGVPRASLRQLSATRFVVDEPEVKSTPLVFELDRQGEPKAVQLGSTRLDYRDIGSEIVKQIRAGVNADPGRLRATAMAANPPVEAPPARPFELINLASIDRTIKFDIRYAGSNNFIGFPLYERSAAYLQRPAAEALGRVERSLASKGYGLLIHDAYRPWFVTKMFWDATPSSAHVFVADPAQGSRHNRGCAVDLTLYSLESGQAVEMTGRYDEMSPRSYADYVGGTSRQRWMRELLRNEMEAQGFTVYPEEWWHFDYKDWKDYAIGTAAFRQLESVQHDSSR